MCEFTTEVYLSFVKTLAGTYAVQVRNPKNLPETVIIPPTYNGIAVTKIAYKGFYGCASLKNIILPESIVEIDRNAFGNSGVESVTLSEGISDIKDYAFSYCKNLKSITIPDSISSIADTAFEGTFIEEATVPAYALSYIKNDKLKHVTVFSDSVIHSDSLRDCKSLVRVDLHDGVRIIANEAFYGCTDLKSITIPNNVTRIDDGAFEGCTGLTSITIPDMVTAIGSSAFLDCSSLTEITIPSSVTRIGYNAFYGCSGLKRVSFIGSLEQWAKIKFANETSNPLSSARSLYINNQPICEIELDVEEISNFAFAGSNIEKVFITDTVKKIPEDTFYSCENLKEITVADGNENYMSVDGNLYTKDGTTLIQYAPNSPKKAFSVPEGVTKICFHALMNAELDELKTPEGINFTTFGSHFPACPSLKKIIISNTAQIDAYTLLNLTKLKEIVVAEENENYTSIDGNLYTKDGKTLIQYASSKEDKSFVIPNGVTSIHSNAFKNPYLDSITIPKSLTDIKEKAFSYIELESFYVDESNPGYKTVDGSLFTKDGKTLIKCACKKITNTFIIPCGVTEIGDCAFANSTVESITIPYGVTRIRAFAFDSCERLKSITLPDTLTDIDFGAFNNCSSLTSVTIPNSVIKLEAAFKDCTALESITIPKSVKEIYYNTFYGCQNLTAVYFMGTTDDWKYHVYKDRLDFFFDEHDIICSDGVVKCKNGR